MFWGMVHQQLGVSSAAFGSFLQPSSSGLFCFLAEAATIMEVVVDVVVGGVDDVIVLLIVFFPRYIPKIIKHMDLSIFDPENWSIIQTDPKLMETQMAPQCTSWKWSPLLNGMVTVKSLLFSVLRRLAIKLANTSWPCVELLVWRKKHVLSNHPDEFQLDCQTNVGSTTWNRWKQKNRTLTERQWFLSTC